MKIAQVNVFFYPFMVGGAEWYVYNISRELTKMGHEVHVFTADKYDGTKAKSEEVVEGITVHRLPLRLDLTYRVKVWNGLEEALAKGSFDVIHTYDYAQPHSKVAIRAGRKAHVGTALTVFDVHSMIPRTWYKQFPMKMMEGYLGRDTLAGVDRILVRAPTLVPRLIELGGKEDRILITPSGIRDESLGVFDGAEFRKKHSIEGAPLVLYLGRLNPLKGPQYLIEAAPAILKEFPKASFVFVGPDQSGYVKPLQERAAKLGIGSRVHFPGPIYDFEEKMQAYASSDVFVLPTAFEGTSQAIFEAMAQGKPVVATRVGGIPSQLTDGEEGFLVEHADPGALAAKVIEVLKTPGLASEMGKKGRQKVEAHRYSILASNLVKIYQQVSEDGRSN
ncbi:MAG: glycosyltransferase family 4 protein [Thaumarchaeota archaeon]|nr:glycosyltransferase family 4 protein [Nitrososphaerota archaeon]